MQAIILVGGMGTRLRAAVPDLPKPMAPISDKPFLAYLLDYLQNQGINQVVLSVGYMQEKIAAYFKLQYKNIHIRYAVEDEPLGTGGAILHALGRVANNQPVFVLNGDTLVKINYAAMYHRHLANQANFTMALRTVSDCSRYGKVIVEHDVVTEFKEKGEQSAGYINAGVYLFTPDYFRLFNFPQKFSLEQDFLFPQIAQLKPDAFVADDYFIDIGIPEDYERAKCELPLLTY